MHQVTGKYPDSDHPLGKSSFYLDADQSFNPYSWQPPINWTGSVGDRQVKFTQIESHGSDRSCYDWSGFPRELDSVISYIVEAIDKAMRVMD